MKKIDKALANTIGEEFRAAVAEIAKRHGLVVAKHIRCSYSSGGVHFPAVEVAVPPEGATSEATTPEALAFTREASRFGLDPKKHFGATITCDFGRGPEQCKITGLLPKSRKYPIVLDMPGGRRKVALKPVLNGLVTAGLLDKSTADAFAFLY